MYPLDPTRPELAVSVLSPSGLSPPVSVSQPPRMPSASCGVKAPAERGEALELAIKELDQSFFKVRFDRCNPSEKKYMRSLAEFGHGKHRSGDIADRLGVKVTSVAPTRSALIKKA